MNQYTLDWVWAQRDLKRSEKLVLLLLAYEAGGGSVLTMPKEAIAQKCNISIRTVDECIRQLVIKGDASDVGSDIADAIIQQACFGQVIYG